jgi:hypothetical protein
MLAPVARGAGKHIQVYPSEGHVSFDMLSKAVNGRKGIIVEELMSIERFGKLRFETRGYRNDDGCLP